MTRRTVQRKIATARKAAEAAETFTAWSNALLLAAAAADAACSAWGEPWADELLDQAEGLKRTIRDELDWRQKVAAARTAPRKKTAYEQELEHASVLNEISRS